MSKLIDKLRRTTQDAPRRLGFSSASAGNATVAPILLVAELDNVDAARVAKEADIGADAILWRAKQAPDPAVLTEAATHGAVPLGLALASVSPDKWVELQDNGCDFVVAGSDASSRALDLDALGRVLEVSLATDDLLLRTLEQLPVDAVLAREGITQQADLTIDRLMSYQRLSLLAHKPIIVPVGSRLEPSELGLLRDAGVRGILVRDDSPEAHETIGALRQALNTVPPRKRRREERLEPLIPPPSHPATEQEKPLQPGEPDEIPYAPDGGRGTL